MDDDRDIVAKLRDWADIYAYAIVSDELLEAAGEIVRLRNRIRELDQALSDAEHQLANPGN